MNPSNASPISAVKGSDTGLDAAYNLSPTSNLYFGPLETRRPDSIIIDSFPTPPVIQTVGGSDARNRGTLGQHGLCFTESPPQPCRSVTFCALPDEVVLEIFRYHMDRFHWHPEDAWHILVHVCRQWRYVVFTSPRSLNLLLRCTNTRSVQTMLDIWPALPIVIEGRCGMSRPQVERNVITALKQRDRVRKIDLSPAPISLLKRIMAIKRPFPALTDLDLCSTNNEKAPVLPDSFLGGSAPCLRSLHLDGIPFPALPKLLLSTTELVDLALFDIPRFGYISPEAMATSLGSLTRLRKLSLRFQSPPPHDAENRLLPLLARTLLPALTSLHFIGDNEYLEDILSRIDAPFLESIDIEPFNELVFDTRQLRHLIRRTEIFEKPLRAVVEFFGSSIVLGIYSRANNHRVLALKTSRIPLLWRVSSFAQFCSSALPPLPALESLAIRKYGKYWQGPIENTEWLELLRSFASVKNLALSDNAAGCLVPSLQGLTVESVTGVLPVLERLSLKTSARSGPIQEAIAQFVATRRLSDRPVAVLYDD